MSWIRNHVRHFVVPGIYEMARVHRSHQPDSRFWKMTDINVEDKDYPVHSIRPEPGYPTKELGMIAAALTELRAWSALEPMTHEALHSLEVSNLMPNLHSNLRRVDGHGVPDILHTLVKNSFRALRRIIRADPRRRLILPGRDVWLWSVMCHKKGLKHTFDARISRGVARNHEILGEIMKPWKVGQYTVVFDTGFAGSIYNHISQTSKKQPINLMLSTLRKSADSRSEQLFPNHQGARGKALTIEHLPKYQKTGTVREGRPVQWLAKFDEYIRAAILTIWFWHHESPRYIGQRRCSVVGCSCRSCKLWKESPMPYPM